MDDDSPFVLDPNKCDGYPSVYNLPDNPNMDYQIDTHVRDIIYGTFDTIGNNAILSGYPSMGYDIGYLPYAITDTDCRSIVYGSFTHIGNNAILSGCPSFNYDIGYLPYAVPDKDCRDIVYGHFTDIGKDNILSGCPSYKVDIGYLPYTVPDPDCRAIVYGTFSDINTEKIDGYPVMENTMDPFETFGAFYDTPKLSKIKIPPTVKFIADYAFYRTNLKKATISPDCIYYEHSFPEECQVEFYEE